MCMLPNYLAVYTNMPKEPNSYVLVSVRVCVSVFDGVCVSVCMALNARLIFCGQIWVKFEYCMKTLV